MNNKDKLKALDKRISGAKEDAATANREYSLLVEEKKDLEIKVNKEIWEGELVPRVTDHAIVRYMERAMGFDMEGCKANLLNSSVVAAIESGASCVSIDGVSFRIKDKAIITTI